MDHSELNRRDFERLTLAALGGMVAGTQFDCRAWAKDEEENPLLGDKHVCRGINTCKGKGADKKNECAGQGTCAIAKEHSCHKENECKGQGGCGKSPGENKCKGMGECAVPLNDKAWDKARKRFEELMKKKGKKVGPAPKKPKKK
jgi:hypothetical protein